MIFFTMRCSVINKCINCLFYFSGAVGCHLDRHENIGKGKIGLEGFKRFMVDPKFDGIPMILETPWGNYSEEIKLLNYMAASSCK